MMNELIAKKYAKALAVTFSLEELESVANVLEVLAKVLQEPAIAAVVNSPEVSKERRAEILLGAIEQTNSSALENFIKLLVEKSRVSLLSDIADALKRYIADEKKNYRGVVYSDSEIDAKILNELAKGLGKKYGSSISLEYIKSGFDGIKVDVEDLGIEISFSKSRINKQIVAHVLQAI